ncbi:WD40 repeat-like protein [Trichodelitschia bisporula]|uniref:WD40 repeat-like protein n=1 Tax=Trichodelitschia bisporula TaxID=703511 RepID=A0A6G1I0K4_9PEZI|nr:WD40 repeat-like protein [Trichodelitschia bisporula]
MNASLIDPALLAQDCPEALTGSLRSGHSTCIRFSHRGDLLASGRFDGTVVLFDLETNGLARKLRGHTAQIQSLSWSSDDRYLLSSSQDCKAILWDLKDGSRVRTVRFEAPVFIADLHPKNHLLFVAALFEEQPVLVDISTPDPVKQVLTSAPHRSQIERDNQTEKQAAQDAKQTTTVIIFSASGAHIIAGTNKGWVNIIDPNTCQNLYSVRLTTGVVILIRLTASGKDMVVNSSDRIIRTIPLRNLSSPELDFHNFKLEVEHKFQDLVNRLSWNCISFSSTGEYLAASTWMNHDIYVWERGHGSLVKILEGPKEELSIIDWHPHRPAVAAVGVDTGRVYMWSILTPQRWSALAPDFVEIEENLEYIEREDEFDIQPPEELHKRRLDLEDEEVDVLTIEPMKNEHEPGQFLMPVLLDVQNSDSEDDIVAVGTGQFRRKTPGQEWLDDSQVPGSGDEARRQTNGASSSAQPGPKRKR